MTHDEFIQLLHQPELVDSKHIPDLKEMVSYYPFFAEAKVLLARAMLISKNLHASHYVDHAALCVPDRRVLFFYLFPDKKISSNPLPVERIPKYEGTYFDMVKAMEAEDGDSKASFKNLAQKLKEARQKMVDEPVIDEDKLPSESKARGSIPEYFDLNTQTSIKEEYWTEDYAKKLIKDRNYEAALEILKKLNLINPKKSIYFADQIRFLEKIIINTK